MPDSTPTPNQPSLPAKAGSEIGESGTLIYKGFITSEEYNYDLTGIRGLQAYDIMRRSDPTIHAVLSVVKNPIIGADHDIEAADDESDINEEIARFVKRELLHRNITWPDFVREGATSFEFGHAVFEIVFELTTFEGKPRIGLKKLAFRKQRTIEAWATLDSKPGITQNIVNVGTGKPARVSIPRMKLIIITNEREGDNLAGISMLRSAYKPWKIKDALELMNAIALERMSVGIPILRKTNTNSTVSEPELDRARNSLRQMRANEEAYLELPEGVDVEMLDMQAQSTKEVLPTIEHLNTQIALSALAQFLMLGSGQSAGGSRAVSQDHTSLFNKSLEGIAKNFQKAIQDDLIKTLVDLNYSNVTDYPRYVINGIADDDVNIISTAVSALINAGAITANAETENRLRKLVGLPELSEKEIAEYEERHKQPDTTPTEEKKDDTKQKDAPQDSKKESDDLDKEDAEEKQTNASIIADAKSAKKKLIDIILRD
ncbi:MAG: DUF935 family protein [Flavobacteriales bacterium]|nr:DUF935 family protein [Flavobacteriales bacterium]